MNKTNKAWYEEYQIDSTINTVRKLAGLPPRNPRPVRVVFNPPYTITYFSDQDKVVVKATNEEFSEEKGVAMCIVKKFVPNRTDLLRLIESAERPSKKEEE
jgi:hypothetical protein